MEKMTNIAYKTSRWTPLRGVETFTKHFRRIAPELQYYKKNNT
jgi:hypothetical protein